MNRTVNRTPTDKPTEGQPSSSSASAEVQEKQTGAQSAPGFAFCGNPVENSRRPIPFKVICAIASRVLKARPYFTDCEWKEAVKVMAARQGWEPPTNDQLARALDAVERSAAKAGRTRQIPAPSSHAPSLRVSPAPLTRAEAAAAFRQHVGFAIRVMP